MDERIEKYKKKLSGDNRKRLYDAQKERMVRLETAYFKDAEKIQNQVKQMIGGEPSILQHYYMDFAMEIYRLLKTHEGQTLITELEILDQKWESRGLRADLLNTIKTFYVPTYPTLIPAIPPILWNKLGSDAEVTNSEIGPDFAWIGTPDYRPAKFNNGVYSDNAANYLTTTFDGPFNPNKWTVEAWIKPTWACVNGVCPEVGLALFEWFKSATDRIIIGENALGENKFNIGIKVNNVWTPFRCNGFNWNANDLIHVAFVYDRDGIDGGPDIVRAYLNGVVTDNYIAGSSASAQTDGVFRLQGIASAWPFDGTIDNLKIYDYAKTDFSDRDIEGI